MSQTDPEPPFGRETAQRPLPMYNRRRSLN
ncbi:protein of unknown function [Cupriavidus taiwanensis]|nr:protein of unknown function [Cupriavidus taiwanensis]